MICHYMLLVDTYDNDTLHDTSSNGDIAGKGTLFINIISFNGTLRCLETQANVLEVASSTFLAFFGYDLARCLLDGFLLLERFFCLYFGHLVLGVRLMEAEEMQ
eukprot:TRINITY_DN57_c0_g1_i9.p1 TRINITY_DN57_c0_g1~~TRINITY_DN57_c0_g1_i9.p1  ORF type:complete len:104 (-),score=4.63 TRINITY_DN57_c0_g1_i9:62-373(-)